MRVTIDALEAAGPGSRARRLVFSSGAEPRLTSASVVKQLGLEVGDELDIEELLSSLAEAEPAAARERALQLLGYRERSEHELLRALTDDGFPAPVARAIVDRFIEVELVDDSRFASSWVRSRVASGFGRRRIARELRDRGVDDTVAEQALTDVTDDDEVRRARDSLRGRVAQTRAERDKLLRRLIGRGFDMRVALAALDRQEPEDDGYSEDMPL